MKLAGRIAIAAPADQVWALVVDPVRLASCVPGVHEVRAVDERTFEGSITAAIGPLEGQFTFTSIITSAEFPDHLTVELAGIDSVTKSRLEGSVNAAVSDVDDQTTLVYTANVTVHGRLAILGEMVIRATAGQMIAHVTECLRARLQVDTLPPSPAPA